MQPDQQGNYWQPPSPDQEVPLNEPPRTVVPIVTMAGEEDLTSQEDTTNETGSHLLQPVRWQANEYIHQEKDIFWFLAFGVIVLTLIAVAIFIMQAWTFALLIAVMAAAVVVYTRRPPRVLTYTISEHGLHIGDHLYSFSEFKSFGVIRDGDEYSVMLIPVKRFMPGVTVYFPEESGEQIVDMLGARLPMQELHLDLIDRVVRKLRL